MARGPETPKTLNPEALKAHQRPSYYSTILRCQQRKDTISGFLSKLALDCHVSGPCPWVNIFFFEQSRSIGLKPKVFVFRQSARDERKSMMPVLVSVAQSRYDKL